MRIRFTDSIAWWRTLTSVRSSMQCLCVLGEISALCPSNLSVDHGSISQPCALGCAFFRLCACVHTALRSCTHVYRHVHGHFIDIHIDMCIDICADLCLCTCMCVCSAVSSIYRCAHGCMDVSVETYISCVFRWGL